MDVFFDQYFDLDIMRDNFGYVLEGFWLTIQLALVTGALCAGLGSGARAAARVARSRDAAGARARDRLHRPVPRHSAAARDPADRRQPAGARLPAEWLRAPDFLGKPEIFWYGVMAITLTYGAYYAEVYRAGLEAVPYGQMEAARSLGMSHAKAMRHVIVPQAIRKVIPPMLNDFIALMKDTSLVGRDRAGRGRQGRPRGPGRDLQQLGADARRADVRRRDDPAGTHRRPADRAPAALRCGGTAPV